MTTTYQPEFGERLTQDHEASGLSSTEYGKRFAGGLSGTKVTNLKNGREPYEDERIALAHLIVDTSALDQATIAARYAETYERLGSRKTPKKLGYSSEWGVPGQGDPAHWASIVQWCNEVDDWLEHRPKKRSTSSSSSSKASAPKKSGPTYQPEIGQRMAADRKERGLNRAEYASLLGLEEARVRRIERGSHEPKPEELTRLGHLAFTPETTSGTTSETTPTQQPTPSTDDPVADFKARKQVVIDRYAETYTRLAGRQAPIPYTATWGTPEQGDPDRWPDILGWCDQVNTWIDLQDAAAEAPEIGDARIIDFPSNDEVDDEELDLAIVTEEPWAFPEDDVKRVSNGELRSFKRCRRKWWLSSYRKLDIASHSRTGAAQLGTRVHRCLAEYYVPGFVNSPSVAFEMLERTIAEDLEVVGGDEFARGDLMKERDLAHAMLEGYFEWLEETAADQGLEVVASETRLEVDTSNMLDSDRELHLIAKIDTRVTRTFGNDVARLFIDHKTVGDLTSPTKMLQFDEQMLHYDLCEYLDLLADGVSADEAAAVRTDGALYNMLRKVKRTERAKPPFYGRVEVRHNVETLRSYWMRVKGTVEGILELEAQLDAGADPRQVAYPNPTKDCSWQCSFYHVCTMFDDGSRAEDMLSSQFVTVDPLRRYATGKDAVDA